MGYINVFSICGATGVSLIVGAKKGKEKRMEEHSTQLYALPSQVTQVWSVAALESVDYRWNSAQLPATKPHRLHRSCGARCKGTAVCVYRWECLRIACEARALSKSSKNTCASLFVASLLANLLTAGWRPLSQPTRITLYRKTHTHTALLLP